MPAVKKTLARPETTMSAFVGRSPIFDFASSMLSVPVATGCLFGCSARPAGCCSMAIFHVIHQVDGYVYRRWTEHLGNICATCLLSWNFEASPFDDNVTPRMSSAPLSDSLPLFSTSFIHSSVDPFFIHSCAHSFRYSAHDLLEEGRNFLKGSA